MQAPDRWLKRAQTDRLIFLNPKNNVLTYLEAGTTRSYTNPEEKIQLQSYLHLIYQLNYPAAHIAVNQLVQIGSSRREADIIVYTDSSRKSPLLVVECKKAGVSDAQFVQATEQGFSYATALSAPYIWVTSGTKQAAFELWPKQVLERTRNRLPGPPAYQKQHSGFWQFRKAAYRFLEGNLKPLLATAFVLDAALLGVFTLLLFGFSSYALGERLELLWPEETMPKKLFWLPPLLWLYLLMVVVSARLSIWLSSLFFAQQLPWLNKPRRYLQLAALLAVPSVVSGLLYSPFWFNKTHLEKLRHPVYLFLEPYIPGITISVCLLYLAYRFGKKPKTKRLKRKRKK